jgi:sulfur carrier protein
LCASLPFGGRAFFIVKKGGNNLQLSVNGKKLLIPDGLSIAELIVNQGFNPNIIVIEYNKKIVKQEDWQTIVLQAEDSLEVVTFVGGG